MKTRAKIILGVMLAGVLGFVIFMPHGGYRRAVEDYKQDLRAKGEKLTIAELALPPSSDPANGAKLFMAVSNLGNWPTNLPSRMTAVAPGHARIGYTNMTPDQLQSYASNINTMAELRAALKGGVLNFNLDYSMGYELLLPHLARLKQAEQLASGTALQALYQKDYDEAWTDLLAGADLVRLPRDEPIMISDLVRVADLNIAIPATWEALESHVWTDAQLADLQARWEEADLFKNAEPILAIERAMGSDAMVKARRSPDKFFELTGLTAGIASTATSGAGGGSGTEFWQWANEVSGGRLDYWFWRSSWSYDEELYNLRLVDAAMETVRRIRATGAAYPALNELPAKFTNIAALHPEGSNHFRAFILGYGQIYANGLAKFADGEAYRRLLVTAIALKRYQLAHGANPATLNALAPDYLRRVPADFMDGKPLRYRLQPDGDFLLYSVGRNAEDDGGNADDRVWPRPATPAQLQQYLQREESSTVKPVK